MSYSLTKTLVEHYVNIDNGNEMKSFVDEVWALLQTAYSGIGGFHTATSPEHLIHKTDFWKAVRRDGKLVAVVVYVNRHGYRKALGVGHNGTRQGKRDAVGILRADVNLDRSWIEVSGRAEELEISLGATMLPNQYAEILTGKEILSLNDDGYHYTRLIAGKPFEKVMMGPKDIIKGLDKQ